MRSDCTAIARPAPRPTLPAPRGYTLVELLAATTLTLVMMGMVVTIFGTVTRVVSDSRAVLEMTERLRGAKARLQNDLECLTVVVSPPRDPAANEGYFEIIEGRIGPVVPPAPWPVDAASLGITDVPVPVDADTGMADTTVRDFDDILMFTVRSRKDPFIGRYGYYDTAASQFKFVTIESHEAEVAWFVRGHTLYRRVRLIAPHVLADLDVVGSDGVVGPADLTALRVDTSTYGFFGVYDISARPATDAAGNNGWVPNTLGDLTIRENRFGHRVHPADGNALYRLESWGQMGLPTLRECSHPNWMTWTNVNSRPGFPVPVSQIDLWNYPHPWQPLNAGDPPVVEPVTGTVLQYGNMGNVIGYEGPRVAEDVILTNVIGFDVKVWDPQAPILRGVNDLGTPLDLTDESARPDYGSIGSVHLAQGDFGYNLALAHYMVEMAKPNPADRIAAYFPVNRGSYVDLGYPYYSLNAYGLLPSSYATTFSSRRWYDTWSSSYEHDGVDQDGDGTADEGSDGFDSPGNGLDDDGNGTVDDNDDTGNGIVDDYFEVEAPPPYRVPLRGIQVKIRTFEPDSRQVREVTLVVDFLQK